MRYNEEEALQSLIVTTASTIGDEFFPTFVENLAKVLNVRHALISVLADEEMTRAKSRAFWADGKLGASFEYELEHTACGAVYQSGKTCSYPCNAQSAFPKNPWFVLLETESYLGVPLFDRSNQIIGLIAILDSKPLIHEQRARMLMELFASRVSAELERQRTEEALRLSEAKAQAYARELEKSINQLQQTQAQLIQTEKISSLGQLTAGLAHEVNNPVSFILGNLSHLQQSVTDLIQHLHLYQQHYPEPSSAIQDHAEEIDLAYMMQDLPQAIASMKLGTDRIHEIMQSLRNYSRVDGATMKAVDLHEGITATLIILSHRLKAIPERPAIQVVKQFGNLPFVKCYPGQLNQVFTNLIANAIDALEESNLGKTHLELEQSPNVITIQTSCDQTYATIAITDNGAGMSEATQQKLFQSFLTTKPEGKGTGLGLSISHEIVTQKHGGSIGCVSILGQGTAFTIRIKL